MHFPPFLSVTCWNDEILMLVQLHWRRLSPCGRPGKHTKRDKRNIPQRQSSDGGAGFRVMSGAVFWSWWPRCLFCASGIKGRHCWNEKQMLVRNSPDCSSFFHARASNAASVHRSPSYFLSLSLSAMQTIHISISPLSCPTLTPSRPALLLNLCNNLHNKAFLHLPVVRAAASVTLFWSKRRRERMRKRDFFLIAAWDFSVTPDFEVCHVDRIPVWGRRPLSWLPCVQAASDGTPQ